jgi:hypothetical protein
MRLRGAVGVIASLILCAASYRAQESSVPRLVEYKGELGKTWLGQTLTGVQSVTFALYSESEGGSPLWIETQNVTGDASGRFTAMLGAGGAGFPTPLLAAGETRWLGVWVNISGMNEQPRARLVSAPYALRAADTELFGGRPLADFALVGGNGGATTGKQNPGSPVTLALQGTGSLNRIAKWTDNSGTLGDAGMVEVAGNVGIGTAAPTATLDVASFGAIGFNLRGGTADGSTTLLNLFDSLGRPLVQSDTAGTIRLSNAGNERVRITPEGNVGIGTTAPTATLDVASFGAIGFNLRGGTADGSTTLLNLFDSLGRPLVQSDTSGTFRLSNAGNERLRITPAGNVGIGTTAPGATLDVVSSAPIALQLKGSSADGSTALLNLFDSNGQPLVQSDTAGLFRFSNSGTERVRITPAGSLGIGTTSPAEKLDVAGNVRANTLISTVATGTAPLTVSSTTQVANLNASLLGGLPASSFGDITGVTAGAGLTGGATSGNASLAISTAALTRGITYLGGCDTCSVLADADDQKTIYLNVIGSMTIQSVTCFSDTGSPTINIQRDDGSPANILSSDLACSTSGATTTTFSGSEASLNLNDKLDFVMSTAGGAAKRVTVSIKALVN